MHILMLLANPYRPDPRAEREALALTKEGHLVTLLCWDRHAEFPQHAFHEGIEIFRVQSVRTGYGSGWRQIFYTPRFWWAAIRMAQKIRPDVVHCHDLDTLYAGVQLKKRIECALIYDAHEDYPALMTLYLPRPMTIWLSWLERRLLKSVDYTITASSVFGDKLGKQGVEPLITIGNYQNLEAYDAVRQVDIIAARANLGLKPEDYVIAYIGGFTRNRLLMPLVEAARQLPDNHFLLWGDGHQRQAVESAISSVPNALYLGWLPGSQVPLYTCLADVIYYCLKPDYPGAIYNAPNTLSQAMAAGRPIIANDVGDLGRIVSQTRCGVLLSEVTPKTIRNAVETLCDPILRNQMGQAGRSAAETIYNWDFARAQLTQVYTYLHQNHVRAIKSLALR